MLHHRVDCPHCGNEIVVNNAKEVQRCRWCRRFVSVKLEKKKKKIRCEIEPLYYKPINSFNDWEDKDFK